MGGHGHHQAGNEKNHQETDDQMTGKIQRIDTIKWNPNHFHLEALDAGNAFTVLGGVPAFSLATLGALFSFSYYSGQSRQYNFYANNFRGFGRMAFGFTLGLALGYKFFGDRQRLHNAYIAECVRRRYPESMGLNTADLWKFKGVKPNHEFYRWV